MTLIKDFEKYIKNISSKDKIAVLHDTDPDGICSAVIIAKTLQKLKNKKITYRSGLAEKKLSGKIQKILKRKGITKLIILDISSDQDLENLRKVSKKIDVLILDHHKIYFNKKIKNVLLIKPQLISKYKPYEYCTAKLAYDLCSRLVEIKDMDWIAATASIADIAHKPWKEWLKKVFKRNKIKMKKDLFKTKPGKLASMISSAEVSDKKNVAKCYQIIYNANSLKQAFTKELKKIKKKVDKELKRLIKGFKKSEKYKSLYIYEITSKIEGIKSPLSTILGLKYPHRTIVIISRKGSKARISARRGDKEVAVNSLLEKAARDLPAANAGGHVPSAGATISVRDYPKFKKRLIEEYSRLENK